MAVHHVLDLVGQDAGQLLGALRPLQQAAKDDDEPARRGQRVDRRVIRHDHPERITRLGQRLHQSLGDRVDAPLPLAIDAAAAGRRQLGYHRVAERDFPRHRDAGRQHRGQRRNAPEVEPDRQTDGGHAGEHRQGDAVATPARVVKRRGRLGRGRPQRRQKAEIPHQQGLGQLAAALQTHLLACVEPLGLSHLGERPAQAAAAIGKRDLETRATDPHPDRAPHRRLTVQIVRVPHPPACRHATSRVSSRRSRRRADRTALPRWRTPRARPGGWRLDRGRPPA
jgi:hypothetical protein